MLKVSNYNKNQLINLLKENLGVLYDKDWVFIKDNKVILLEKVMPNIIILSRSLKDYFYLSDNIFVKTISGKELIVGEYIENYNNLKLMHSTTSKHWQVLTSIILPDNNSKYKFKMVVDMPITRSGKIDFGIQTHTTLHSINSFEFMKENGAYVKKEYEKHDYTSRFTFGFDVPESSLQVHIYFRSQLGELAQICNFNAQILAIGN